MTRSALAPTDDVDVHLQDALGSFPSGITVVTTSADGEPYGMTVSAFSALSVDPPLVLVCVANGGRGLDLLTRSGAFCVNVLAAAQASVARRFASRRRPRGAAMFDGVPHGRGTTGAPVLHGAAAHLECALERLHDGGDHTIVVGRVLRSALSPQARPLVVHRRELTTVEHVSRRPAPPLVLVRTCRPGTAGGE